MKKAVYRIDSHGKAELFCESCAGIFRWALWTQPTVFSEVLWQRPRPRQVQAVAGSSCRRRSRDDRRAGERTLDRDAVPDGFVRAYGCSAPPDRSQSVAVRT